MQSYSGRWVCLLYLKFTFDPEFWEWGIFYSMFEITIVRVGNLTKFRQSFETTAIRVLKLFKTSLAAPMSKWRFVIWILPFLGYPVTLNKITCNFEWQKIARANQKPPKPYSQKFYLNSKNYVLKLFTYIKEIAYDDIHYVIKVLH